MRPANFGTTTCDGIACCSALNLDRSRRNSALSATTLKRAAAVHQAPAGGIFFEVA